MTTNQELRKLALDATPQDIDTAEIIEKHKSGERFIECPYCQGSGEHELEADYCNYDSVAIGVQFYGIGKHHGAAEAFFRAANPAKVIELLDRIDRLEAENERAREAFHQIKSWSEAYPLSVFPEPDFEKAHQVLTANGMTLDAISASNMRHVITEVQAIVDAVIPERKEAP